MTGSVGGIAAVRDQALAFRDKLREAKLSVAPANQWYPYDILSNFVHIERLLTGENRFLFDRLHGATVADIGAADGDSGFFLESLGAAQVDIIDNPETNNNRCKGADLLHRTLKSRATIANMDLDSQFRLPRERYSLILFLGILYHLKNPFYALESLARASRYCIVSTRIARYASNRSTEIAKLPVAYLVDAYETNNDPSNYWIFSEAGLKRLFARCGWGVLDYMTVGNTTHSDPASPEGDERAFALLKSSLLPGDP